jgi:hypothetical protein
MIRLTMIVEGQTEQEFVRQVLVEPLSARNIFPSCRCVETSRDRRHHRVHRGGFLRYAKAKEDIERWMKANRHSEAHFTIMFDLYALPDDFPSRGEAGRLADPQQKVERLEEAFAADINHQRFIPYLQLHEFEALLLADPRQFDWEFVDHAAAIDKLVTLSGQFTSPELIDEGATTAPSKRIIQILPDYEDLKTTAGPAIASRIGLPTLRAKCRHFHDWLARIEALAPESSGA